MYSCHAWPLSYDHGPLASLQRLDGAGRVSTDQVGSACLHQARSSKLEVFGRGRMKKIFWYFLQAFFVVFVVFCFSLYVAGLLVYLKYSLRSASHGEASWVVAWASGDRGQLFVLFVFSRISAAG